MQRAGGQGKLRESVELGEKVLFQPMSRHPAADKIEPRWHYGIFLGPNLRSNEVILGNADDGATAKAWSLAIILFPPSMGETHHMRLSIHLSGQDLWMLHSEDVALNRPSSRTISTGLIIQSCWWTARRSPRRRGALIPPSRAALLVGSDFARNRVSGARLGAPT